MACDLEEAFRSDRKVESSVYTVLLTRNRLFGTWAASSPRILERGWSGGSGRPGT